VVEIMEWFEVRVTIDDDVFEDAIMGTSRQDALMNAYDNWEDAERIEVI
jgi:hypothetical protein